MQMDQRGIIARAVSGLIQPLAPHRQRRLGLAKPACGLDDILCRHAACRRGSGRRQLAHLVAHCGESCSVGGDKSFVHQPFPQHHMQHGAVQNHIAARRDGQMHIGHRGCIGAARVDDDDLELRIIRLRVFDTAEHNRMRPSRVAAGEQK